MLPLPCCLATQFVALMIPNSPGAVFDLWKNDSMTSILEHFVSEKSRLTLHVCLYVVHVCVHMCV